MDLLDPSEALTKLLVALLKPAVVTEYQGDVLARSSEEGRLLAEQLTDQLWTKHIPLFLRSSRRSRGGHPRRADKDEKLEALLQRRRQFHGAGAVHGHVGTGVLNFTWVLNSEKFVGEVVCSTSMTAPLRWVAVGFTEGVGMHNADIVVARLDDRSQVFLEDRWATGFRIPAMDLQQDYHLLNYSWDEHLVRFAFHRSLKTDDGMDLELVASPVNLIWAFGSGNDFQGHDERGSEWIDLFRGRKLTESQPKSFASSVEITEFKMRLPLAKNVLSSPVNACMEEMRHQETQGTCHNPAGTSKSEDGSARMHSIGEAFEVRLGRCAALRGDAVAAALLFEEAAAVDSTLDIAMLHETLLSDHLLARFLYAVCNLGTPTSAFAFTRCRASRGAHLFGQLPSAITAVVARAAQLAALLWGIARVGVFQQLALLALALLYCDAISAAVHLVMDNEDMTRWPAIRAEALGFQSHHEYNTGSLNFPYHDEFGMLIVAIMGGVLFSMLVLCPVPQALAERSRCLFFYSAPMCFYFMNTHAYAHLPATMVPGWVCWAQRWGLLLSREAHLRHHLHFDKDFAVLTGWTHPVFNFLLQRWMHHQDENWAWVLLGLLVLPGVVVGCVGCICAVRRPFH